MGSLYNTVRTVAMMTDAVLVGFSGGKDSAVCLDLCFRHFKRVQPYFLWICPKLDFQERTIRWYENKYQTEIIRLPHFVTSYFLRYGAFRESDESVPIIKTVETYNYLREKTGIYWIASGERIKDSITRRAVIKASGTIDAKRGKIYPIANFSKSEIYAYIKARKLRLSAETQMLGFSFGDLSPAEVMVIKKNFPADYEKLKAFYPLIGAAAFWSQLHERNAGRAVKT